MLIYLIVFIEGFCSLGAEIIALRRRMMDTKRALKRSFSALHDALPV